MRAGFEGSPADDEPINFARLKFITRTLLHYNAQETRFIWLWELFEQFEEYCDFNQLKIYECADEEIIPEGAL